MLEVSNLRVFSDSTGQSSTDSILDTEDLYQHFTFDINIGVSREVSISVPAFQAFYTLSLYMIGSFQDKPVSRIFVGGGEFSLTLKNISSDFIYEAAWGEHVIDSATVRQEDFRFSCLKSIMRSYGLLESAGVRVDDLMQRIPPNPLRREVT